MSHGLHQAALPGGGGVLRHPPGASQALLAAPELAALAQAPEAGEVRAAAPVIPTLHWRNGTLEGAGWSVHLGRVERAFLVALARLPAMSPDRLTQALWRDPDHEPGDTIGVLGVHAYNLRRKLRPFGFTIDCQCGRLRSLVGNIHINFRGNRGHRKTPLPVRPYEDRQ